MKLKSSNSARPMEYSSQKPVINEGLRSTPDSSPSYSLPDEIWHLLNQFHKQLDAERRAALKRERALVVPVADQLFLFAKLIERLSSTCDEKSIRALQLIHENLLAWLAQAGYQLADFDGVVWETLDETQAEMQDYFPSEMEGKSVVQETCLPLISYKDEVIRPAKVVVKGPVK